MTTAQARELARTAVKRPFDAKALSVVLFEIYHNFCPPMQGLCLRARHRVKGVRKRYIAPNWWNFRAIVQRGRHH